MSITLKNSSVMYDRHGNQSITFIIKIYLLYDMQILGLRICNKTDVQFAWHEYYQLV